MVFAVSAMIKKLKSEQNDVRRFGSQHFVTFSVRYKILIYIISFIGSVFLLRRRQSRQQSHHAKNETWLSRSRELGSRGDIIMWICQDVEP